MHTNLRRGRLLVLAGLIGGLLAAAIALAARAPDAPDAAAPAARQISATPTLHPDIPFVRAVERDFIRAIDDPQFMRASEAEAVYADDELVIGVAIDGDARAYSVPLLSRHEIVNDVVGGQPIAVTWCPLCFSAIVYDRRVDGTTVTLGVSGLLVHNNLVMFDRETDSLWNQLDGQAVQGPRSGAQLEFVASWFTTWSAWRAQHPETLALHKESAFGDSYAGYYQDDRSGVRRGVEPETALALKAPVIGVAGPEAAVAYPLAALAATPVVNDTLDGTPLLVVFLPAGDTALVYRRTTPEGQVLTFTLDAASGALVDAETGSRWDAWRGAAVAGPLAGTVLRRLPATRAFWFAWRDWHPGTRLFTVD